VKPGGAEGGCDMIFSSDISELDVVVIAQEQLESNVQKKKVTNADTRKTGRIVKNADAHMLFIRSPAGRETVIRNQSRAYQNNSLVEVVFNCVKKAPI
jgi:hypothetical protein